MSDHSTHRPIRYKSLAFLGLPDYRVGDDGSLWSKKHKDWRQLRPAVNVGYYHVCLCHEGKIRQFYVHVLVLLAFVGPCPAGTQSCHNDGNPLNNCLSNLRWDTPRNNHQDRRRHGTIPAGEKNQGAKITARQVRRIREFYNRRSHTERELQELFHLSKSQVNKIINHKSWKHLE